LRELQKERSVTRSRRALVVAGSFAISLSACQIAPSPESDAPSRPASLSSAAMPNAVANRTPLPPCGSETTTQSAGYNIGGRRCFWDAYLARRPAEFISTQPTVEGDPFTLIYRILPAGGVEIFVDQTRDRYSMGGWVRLDCASLSLIPEGRGQPAFGSTSDCLETTLK
jgi:hypothetical protein